MSASASSEDGLELLDDYDFELPESRIAQAPAADREASRLLVLSRETGAVVEPDADHVVADLPRWLRAGDLLVVNATRVLPARLVGRKASGGAAEALLLGPEAEDPGAYRALVKCTGKLRVGLVFRFSTAEATVESLHERGEVILRFAPEVDPYSVGVAPLPPYIRRDGEVGSEDDLDRYQTVYAREPGAVAAPTAGLHFTEALFERLSAQGVEKAEVVLHVGAGTFRPLDADALATQTLHHETYELPEETVAAIERTRARGGRVIAVGTTSTRVLESCVDDEGVLRAGRGETNLFLLPGGRPIQVVDALLTNFHLPRSSLLLLVAAFMGREPMLSAYRHAIERGFRFFSYGDAMLILPDRVEEATDAR
ncbi:MAG: tRNA preQ1(34) S-adenosylmethionine ribosyltransferase-isomerase QueA [Myxococcota bacterium]